MPKPNVVGAIKKKKPAKTNAQKRALQSSWEALLKKHGATPSKRRKTFKALDPASLGMNQATAFNAHRSVTQIPSAAYVPQDPTQTVRVEYTGDMAEREKAARQVQHVVAPAYNKGGLQLITNPDDFKTMGRKV